MDIETLATSALTNSLSRTDRLSGFIRESDKEPAWDGHVYVYETKRHEKDNIKKVYVQVKGKTVSRNMCKDKIKYQVDVRDLVAYQKNGGAIYFVVFIEKNTGDLLQIYYTEMLPLKIQECLEKAKNQKSTGIEFKKFPNDNQEKIALFVDFYTDSTMQHSFAGNRTPTIEELEKQGILESITIRSSGIKDRGDGSGIPLIVNGQESYTYATAKGISTPIPVEYTSSLQRIVMTTDVDVPISVNDVQYFKGYKVVVSEGKVCCEISNCLFVTFYDDDTKPIVIRVNSCGSLNQRIESYPFLCAVLKNKGFMMKKTFIPVSFPKEKLEHSGFLDLENNLTYYREVKGVLEKLNVKKDLNIDDCSDTELWRVKKLTQAIGKNEVIYGVKGDLPIIVRVNFGNIHLLVISDKTEDDGYYLWDFFGKSIPVAAFDDQGESHTVSQFSILKDSDFLSLDNVNYDNIIDDYIRIGPSDGWNIGYANNTLLEMIKAYDKCRSDTRLVNSAKKLAGWLCTQTEYIDVQIVRLNYLQLIARERKLSFEEKAELMEIAKSDENPLYRTGALILLEEYQEAAKNIDLLEDKVREALSSAPIYNLMKQEIT